MDVSTPQGAGASPGLVYTSKGCAAPGGVYSTGPELSLDLSTFQWLVLVLDSIREIGSSIPLNIYFEILLSVRKKRSTQAEPALKKGLHKLSVR
jgi:hypothetical protein